MQAIPKVKKRGSKRKQEDMEAEVVEEDKEEGKATETEGEHPEEEKVKFR